MNVTNKPYVIFAPHIDDEMIGCYRILAAKQVSHVFYFFELTEQRKREAEIAAKTFEFSPIFVREGELCAFDGNSIILAPSIHDSHPDHKKINRFARTLNNKVEFYSVDMNKKFEKLSNREQFEKRESLLYCYQSQKALFEDGKYFLFESKPVSDESFKMIWVTFQKHGLHKYPQAASYSSLSDVKYLGSTHRHLFKFKVSIEVFHDDREIEFHQFQNWLIDLYEGVHELDYQSCEMIADKLSIRIQKKYPGRKLIIEVSEDGENGVTVEYQG